MSLIDQIDMNLIQALWIDSRISFNQLGKNLEISGNILKKRAEKLESEDVFCFHTNPVFSAFNYARIVLIAEIPKQNRQKFIESISKFEEVYEIIFSLGEKCAIVALLPMSDGNGVLDTTVQDFKEKLNQLKNIKLEEQFKMEYSTDHEGLTLKPMEKNLIRLLRENSRKDLVNLSETMNLSKKTLSRYLQKFLKNNLIVHTIGLQPSKIKNFVIHLLFVIFEDGQNLQESIKSLKKEIPNWLSYYVFVEPPGMAFYIYSETIADMEKLIKRIYEMDNIKDVDVFFPSSIERFENWKNLVIPISPDENDQETLSGSDEK